MVPFHWGPATEPPSLCVCVGGGSRGYSHLSGVEYDSLSANNGYRLLRTRQACLSPLGAIFLPFVFLCCVCIESKDTMKT